MSVIAIDSAMRSRAIVVRGTADGDEEEAVVLTGDVLPLLATAAGRLWRPDVSAVVTVTGPGSYTGLRAGMATALGLAHASGVSLHGVGSLEVVSTRAPARATRWLAVQEAGRGGVYIQDFSISDGRAHPDGEARRIPADAIPGGIEVVRLDPADSAAALLAAIPIGLARPALAFAGLAGDYGAATGSSREA